MSRVHLQCFVMFTLLLFSILSLADGIDELRGMADGRNVQKTFSINSPINYQGDDNLLEAVATIFEKTIGPKIFLSMKLSEDWHTPKDIHKIGVNSFVENFSIGSVVKFKGWVKHGSEPIMFTKNEELRLTWTWEFDGYNMPPHTPIHFIENNSGVVAHAEFVFFDNWFSRACYGLGGIMLSGRKPFVKEVNLIGDSKTMRLAKKYSAN